MRKSRVHNFCAILGVLMFCPALLACQSVTPQPSPLPLPQSSASPQLTPPTSLAERCSSRPGAVWRTWRTASNPSAVFALWIDRDMLWAGTSFGVWRVNLQTGGLTAYDEIGATSKLLPIENGRLWAASDRGLFYFDGQKWTMPIRNKEVTQLGVDYDGNLWVFYSIRFPAYTHFSGHIPPASGPWQESNSGLSKESADCQQWQTSTTGSYMHQSHAECQALNQARQAVSKITKEHALLTTDADQSTWWATNSTLGYLSTGYSTTLALSVDKVHALAPDPVHGVWIATDQGLAYSDGSALRWMPLSLDICTFAGTAHDIIVDYKGTAWVQTSGRLRTLSPNQDKWQPVTDLGLTGQDADRPVRAMIADPSGGIWASHGYDLWRFGGSTSIPPVTFPAPNCYLYDLAMDSVGNVWIAAGECGLLQFTPSNGKWRQHRPDYSFYGTAIAADIGGAVYALDHDIFTDGHYERVYEYVPGNTARILDQGTPDWHLLPFLSEGDFWRPLGKRIAADKQGGLWIGSYYTGQVWYYRNKQATPFIRPYVNRVVQQLYVDDQDRLWASIPSREGGQTVNENDVVAVYDDRTWRHISAPVGAIRKLTGGPDGRIWVIGDRGIAVYDPSADKGP